MTRSNVSALVVKQGQIYEFYRVCKYTI